MFNLEKSLKEIERSVSHIHFETLDMRSDLQETFNQRNEDNTKKMKELITSLKEEAEMLEWILSR